MILTTCWFLLIVLDSDIGGYHISGWAAPTSVVAPETIGPLIVTRLVYIWASDFMFKEDTLKQNSFPIKPNPKFL